MAGRWAWFGSGGGGFGFGGEAAKDGFATGVLDEVKGGEGQGEDGDVGDPGLERGEVESLRQVVVVDEDEGVEVEKIEGKGGFAD